MTQHAHEARTFWERHEREEAKAQVSDCHFLFFLRAKVPTACQDYGYNLAQKLSLLSGERACGLERR